MNRRTVTAVALALGAFACKKAEPPPLYEPVAVVRKDITVSAEAAGAVEPILVVDVKSRASGTILEMRAQTGDHVSRGDTLVLVDRRDPTNTLNQANADLDVARAELTNAQAQKTRVDQMFTSQLVSQQENEAAQLTFANARAKLVRAETAVQTARDALDDTNVRAPLDGTIIAKNVEVGNVIASATRDVSGGVVLLRMADLREVQVRTLVDETDIGKIEAGLEARVTVDAYPNQPFRGRVLKIEPQSTTNQNVTMFPVLIRIANEGERLKPGMNASVQIQVRSVSNVLAIPNAALRTQRDVASAAQVLGLNPADVQAQLARADSQQGRSGSMAGQTPTSSGAAGRTQTAEGSVRAPEQPQAAPPAQAPQVAAVPSSTPDARPGGGFQLPEGVTREMMSEIRRKREAGEPLTAAESTASARMRAMRERGGQQGSAQQGGAQQGGQPGASAAAPQQDAAQPSGMDMDAVRAAFQKQRNNQPLTPAEQALLQRARSMMGGGGNRPQQRPSNNFMFGGSYIVFVLREGKPTPVRIRTGVTDLDYSEVQSGLTERDTVLLLPSASLVQSQAEMRDRFQRMTGGGAVPGMQQQTAPTTRPAQTATPGGRPN